LIITFLGTAASSPTATRGLPSVAVRRKDQLFLFDCGEGTQRQIIIARIGLISELKIFVSHIHGDHVLGLPGLFQSMSLFNRTAPLKLYGPTGLGDFVKTFLDSPKFSLTFPIEIREVDEGIIYSEKEYLIKTAWVEHTIPTLAFAIIENQRPGIFYPERAEALNIPKGPLWSKLQKEGKINLGRKIIRSDQVTGPPRSGRKVVYSADTRPCESILKLAEEADVLIYEATFDDKLSKKANEMYHSTPSQAAKIAKEANVKRLILTHIGGRYFNSEKLLEKARLIFPKIDVAEDFMEIEVLYTD